MGVKVRVFVNKFYGALLSSHSFISSWISCCFPLSRSDSLAFYFPLYVVNASKSHTPDGAPSVCPKKYPTCWVYREMALMEPKFRCFFTWLMVMIVSNLISGDSCRFLLQPEVRKRSVKGKEGHLLLCFYSADSSCMYFNKNNSNQQEGGEVADGEEDGRNFWSSSSSLFSHLPMLFFGGCCC